MRHNSPNRWKMKNPNYLKYIRKQGCCVCGREAVAHHVRMPGDGMGQEPPDKRTVPLCAGHHFATHQWGDSDFQKRHGVDYQSIMDKLWRDYEGA